MNKRNVKKNELLSTNTTKMTAGEIFWLDLEKRGYSTDKIGQGFVIYISLGIREPKI